MNKTFIFSILALLAHFGFAASNINCFIERMEKLKKDDILRSLTSSNIALLDYDVQPSFYNERVLAEKDGTSAGHKLNKVQATEQIDHYQMIEEYFQKEYLKDYERGYYLAEKVCKPYLLQLGLHKTPVNIFCHKISKIKEKHIEFMINHGKFGFETFGLIFGSATHEFKDEYVNRQR